MGLENILRWSAVVTLGSASAIFSTLGYRSFERGDNASCWTYTAFTAINIALATLSYRYHSRKINSEETGFFGLPDSCISALEKENHKRRGTVN